MKEKFMNMTPPTKPIRSANLRAARRTLLSFAIFALVCTGLMPLCAGDSALQLPPLTTVPGNPRLPGKFVWADLVTDDLPAARKFYAELFGWTFWGVGGYTIASNDDRPLCGMFQKAKPADKPEAKPRWMGYISVADVDRAQRAVLKAGGRVLAAPQDFPKRGRQALFSDPENAVFGVIKSSAGDPGDFLPGEGDWIWVQLLSRDARKAAEFYRTVAGYEVIENSSASQLSDYVLTSKGFARATVRTIPEGFPQVQANWLPFVRVKSVRESVVKTAQLGGKVLLEPKPELFESRVAVIADPTGAPVGLMEWSQDMAKGAK